MIGKNNIFNIRYVAGNKWLGLSQKMPYTKGFCNFDSVDYCIRAFLKLIRTYMQRYNLRTIGDIITHYAPPSENDTESYINYVCNRLSSTLYKDVNKDYVLEDVYELAVFMRYVQFMEVGFNYPCGRYLDVMISYGINPLI